MNRSYSKIRHIQESNQRLENRLISEQNPKTVAKTTTAGINSVLLEEEQPQPIKIKVWEDGKRTVGYIENYRLNLYNLRLNNQQLVFKYTIPLMAGKKTVGKLNSSGIGYFYCGQGYRIIVKNLKGANMFLYLSKAGRDLLNSKSQKMCDAYASVDNSSVDNIVEPTDYT